MLLHVHVSQLVPPYVCPVRDNHTIGEIKRRNKTSYPNKLNNNEKDYSFPKCPPNIFGQMIHITIAQTYDNRESLYTRKGCCICQRLLELHK